VRFEDTWLYPVAMTLLAILVPLGIVLFVAWLAVTGGAR
jgi:hypothetical protein